MKTRRAIDDFYCSLLFSLPLQRRALLLSGARDQEQHLIYEAQQASEQREKLALSLCLCLSSESAKKKSSRDKRE